MSISTPNENKLRLAMLSGLAALGGLLLALPAAAGALTSTPFTTSQPDPNLSPNNRVGKLILHYPSEQMACSASVVDAANQSVVMTAGHCVYRASLGGLPTSAEFIPAYQAGQKPLGVWPSQSISVAGPWILSGHSHYDYAFIVLGRNANGQAVEDVVGGFPIGFNLPRGGPIRSLGYPAEPNPPYDGERLWQCTTTYGGDFRDPDPDEQYGPSGMYIGCDMSHGASGGPWLNPAGTLVSVNSTTFGTSNPGLLGGPYLDSDAAALFATVTGSPETATCKGQPVTNLGTNGTDRLVGGPETDVMVGGGGRDLISGGGGDDLICGGGGGDRLGGGSGKDVVLGEGGSDRISGGGGKDKCQGGPAKDSLKSCP